MQTPGHTPEHISILVTDRSRGEEPALLLSGGALLVSDVARPDLLGGGEQTRKLAADMCRTLQEKILKLPDHVEVYPTHVAGSLCGGHIGSRLSTTIGYERRLNRMLASLGSRQEFVENCLDLRNLPAVPPYWKRTRKQNQAGPPLLGQLREPPALRVGDFEKVNQTGAVVLDCRSPEAFGGAHIPGALNVGAGSSFPTWAGTVLPPDTIKETAAGKIEFSHAPQRERADLALFYAHRLMICQVEIQNVHFQLGFDDEIVERAKEYAEVWKDRLARINSQLSRTNPVFRFCVGTSDARHSMVWKIWSRTGDIYISNRRGSEFILQQSGECKWSVFRNEPTTELGEELLWQRPNPTSSSAAHVFRIIIPESELRGDEISENSENVRWIAAPAPGCPGRGRDISHLIPPAQIPTSGITA